MQLNPNILMRETRDGTFLPRCVICDNTSNELMPCIILIVGFGEINPQTGGKSLLETTKDEVKSITSVLDSFFMFI